MKTVYPGRYLTLRTLTDNGVESNDSIPIDLEEIVKRSRHSSIYSHDSMNGRERTKSLTRESPSTVSSMSIEMPQIELRANTPRTPAQEKINSRKSSNSPRQFVALFDYDPQAMSPNQDNDEELPFKQGQIIKVSSAFFLF